MAAWLELQPPFHARKPEVEAPALRVVARPFVVRGERLHANPAVARGLQEGESLWIAVEGERVVLRAARYVPAGALGALKLREGRVFLESGENAFANEVPLLPAGGAFVAELGREFEHRAAFLGPPTVLVRLRFE